MIDWFVWLTPVIICPIVLLLVFVGCTFLVEDELEDKPPSQPPHGHNFPPIFFQIGDGSFDDVSSIEVQFTVFRIVGHGGNTPENNPYVDLDPQILSQNDLSQGFLKLFHWSDKVEITEYEHPPLATCHCQITMSQQGQGEVVYHGTIVQLSERVDEEAKRGFILSIEDQDLTNKVFTLNYDLLTENI